MRAVVITRPGPPDVLEICDVPRPEPGPGEIRVRVRAFGINRADLLQRRGGYPAPPGSPASIPGLEYAGEVDAFGPRADRDFAVGDRVMGIVGGGAYAEYLVTPAAHALPIPRSIGFAEAAAIPEAFLTAFDALEQVGVAAGEWVLIHAVGSGVGTAAVQLTRARGARSIGTTRTPSKLKRAWELGIDSGIDPAAEPLGDQVRAITGGSGAHAALDLIGGSAFNATLDALALRGRVILIGLSAGSRAEVDLGLILRRRLRVVGTVLRSRTTDEKAALTTSFRERVLRMFDAGELRPIIDRVMPLDDIRAAHEHVESNANFGKVVVEISPASPSSSPTSRAASPSG